MKKLSFLIFIALCFAFTPDSVGVFQNHGDIGNPKKSGSSSYDAASKTYTLKGSGANVWFKSDEFQYAWKKLKGDFVVTANFELAPSTGNPHRKVGWMLRNSIDADAVHYSAVLHGDGLTALQWRLSKGADMRDPEDEIFAPKKGYSVLQLERHGKQLIFRAAHTGEALEVIGTTEMTNIQDEILAGIFICSHDAGAVEEAKVTNLTIK